MGSTIDFNALTVESLKAEIAEIRQAMSDCRRAGQGYSSGGRTFNRATYDSLAKDLKEKLVMLRKMDGTALLTIDASLSHAETSNATQTFLDPDA